MRPQGDGRARSGPLRLGDGGLPAPAGCAKYQPLRRSAGAARALTGSPLGKSLVKLVVGALAVCLVMLAAGRPAQAAGKTRKVAALDVRAVGDFEPKTIAGLSTLIAYECAQFPVEVISGSDVRAMITYDREKQLLGCQDSTCLAEIGGALGVDLILSSEVSEVGGTWLVSLTMLDVAKAEAGKRVVKRTKSEAALVDVTSEATREIFRLAGLTGAAEKQEARESRRRGRVKKDEAPAEALAAATAAGGEPQYRRRSKGLMITGIALVGVGVLGVLGGAAKSGSAVSDADLTAAGGWMLGGLVLGAVGTPLWIIGRKYVPIEKDAQAKLLAPAEGPQMVLALSGVGLRLSF